MADEANAAADPPPEEAAAAEEQGATADPPAGESGAPPTPSAHREAPQLADPEGALASVMAKEKLPSALPEGFEAPIRPTGKPLSGGLKEKLEKSLSRAEAIGELVTAAPEMEKVADEDFKVPMCGEFVVKDNGRKCHALFIPDGQRLNATKLTALVTQWKLTPPSTMVCCDCGTVHPKQFASTKLVALESFSQYWADALKHAEREGIEKGALRDAFALDVINEVIFLKLVTIFAAVLDAASIANNWIVVDRVNSKSPAAELLIEAAMMQTTSRPTILVIDHIDRLQKFKGPTGDGPLSASAKACIDKFERIKKGAIPLGTDDAPVQEAIAQFYSPAEYDDGATFNDLELPRPPEPAHLNAEGVVPDRVKWQYHYLQTFFAGGSHYIVLESKHDAPDLSSLGPFGYIAANGQALMFPRMKTLIQSGEPLVMLHNTGGVTQAFASLRRAMLRVPMPDPKGLLESLELVSPAPWQKAFGLPEILMMKELNTRAPMLLKTTIMAVDVMKDSSEDVLSVLTCCFAGGGGVPELGLGEAETLCILTAWKRHMTLVENAAKYERSADSLQMFLYFMGVATTTLAVLYGLDTAQTEKEEALAEQEAAMLLLEGAADTGSGSDPNDPGNDEVIAGMTAYELVMVMMPILSTLVGTVRSKMRPREKWSTCLMAASQIVDQIYKYRLRTDRYDTAAPPPSDGDDDEAEEISPKQRETKAREMFVTVCNEIYSNAISTEITKGGALRMGPVGRMLRTQEETDRNDFLDLLRRYVREQLYRMPPRRSSKKRRSAQITPTAIADVKAQPQESADSMMSMFGYPGDDAEEPAEEPPPKQVVEVKEKSDAKDEPLYQDDLKSQMDIETYVECRVRPVCALFERRGVVVSRRLNACEAVALAANTAGAVLAVLDMAQWIAITVAIASVAMALQDYFYISSQLGETNRALQDVHNLLNWWDSLSLVQRKRRDVKARCCATLEGAVLSICSARTGVSASLPGQDDSEDDEEEKKK